MRIKSFAHAIRMQHRGPGYIREGAQHMRRTKGRHWVLPSLACGTEIARRESERPDVAVFGRDLNLLEATAETIR